jgi:hypothetical protein
MGSYPAVCGAVAVLRAGTKKVSSVQQLCSDSISPASTSGCYTIILEMAPSIIIAKELPGTVVACLAPRAFSIARNGAAISSDLQLKTQV